jgi:hypothetical protein
MTSLACLPRLASRLPSWAQTLDGVESNRRRRYVFPMVLRRVTLRWLVAGVILILVSLIVMILPARGASLACAAPGRGLCTLSRNSPIDGRSGDSFDASSVARVSLEASVVQTAPSRKHSSSDAYVVLRDGRSVAILGALRSVVLGPLDFLSLHRAQSRGESLSGWALGLSLESLFAGPVLAFIGWLLLVLASDERVEFGPASISVRRRGIIDPGSATVPRARVREALRAPMQGLALRLDDGSLIILSRLQVEAAVEQIKALGVPVRECKEDELQSARSGVRNLVGAALLAAVVGGVWCGALGAAAGWLLG